MHRATTRFWRCYQSLPVNVRKRADDAFVLVQKNPRHPSLRLKKVGPYLSVRVDITHRALAVADEEDFVWVWIGSHDEYDRMIRTR